MVKITLRDRKTQDEYPEYQIKWTNSAAYISDSNRMANSAAAVTNIICPALGEGAVTHKTC
jgi:hypothetical protein